LPPPVFPKISAELIGVVRLIFTLPVKVIPAVQLTNPLNGPVISTAVVEY
jgi:hypothetical protein